MLRTAGYSLDEIHAMNLEEIESTLVLIQETKKKEWEMQRDAIKAGIAESLGGR